MLVSEMTGKTTLIEVAETPRELVLAWLTGVTLGRRGGGRHRQLTGPGPLGRARRARRGQGDPDDHDDDHGQDHGNGPYLHGPRSGGAAGARSVRTAPLA